MASIGSAYRLSARIANRQLRNHVLNRGFRTSARALAAHNFSMPAMSPTMTEGNIASWKVKEGDAFSAGDVLLEIETDKAQMDVEAQDDGVMAKIIQGDGSKAVKVGTRIAVTADPDDDISSLEIPPEDSAPQSKPAEPSKSSAPEPPKTPKSSSAPSKGAASKSAGTKQKYPLYPSVQQLLLENGLKKEDADKIPATGPSGRLLKGDVLAYLGKIEDSYPAELSDRLKKLSHLDLSNIKLATPAPKPEAAAPPAPVKEAPRETELSLPISLNAVLECQRRVQDSLGVVVPVETFVERAIELANEDLPRSKTVKPSKDELFYAALGSGRAPVTSRGNFFPDITALAAIAPIPSRPVVAKKKSADIYDILTGVKSKATSIPVVEAAIPAKGAVNVFSVSTPKGDEARAMVFLERVKTVLEAEPGSLVVL